MGTYFQGAVKQGANPSEYSTDVGYTVFSRQATLQAPAATTGAINVDVTIPIPAGSQILAIYVDSSVAWTASGTVTCTAGITAGGTEYITSIDLKTVTRGAPTLTAAQLGAMAAPASVNLVVRAAVSAASAGYVGTSIVTALYIPRVA
jgi:hypothetical protein